MLDFDYLASLMRARHEIVNRRFKQFKCLKEVFRHGIIKHCSVSTAVAVITQLTIEAGSRLFLVEHQDEI